MTILTDTNILARVAQPGHPMHADSLSSLKRLRKRGEVLCVLPQVVYELWVVCTRPPEQNGLGMTSERVNSEIDQIEHLFVVLRDERAIYDHWRKVVVDYRVLGKKAHDARLVAGMRRHAVNRI